MEIFTIGDTLINMSLCCQAIFTPGIAASQATLDLNYSDGKAGVLRGEDAELAWQHIKTMKGVVDLYELYKRGNNQ